MVAQQPAEQASLKPPTSGRAILAIGGAILAFIVLISINRDMISFPVVSAIAFLAMVVAPFWLFGLDAPRPVKIAVIVAVVAVAVPVLAFKDGFYLELAIQIGIFAALALGLNIVVGFAGLLDLGYVAFFAVGAYLWSIFNASEDTFVRLAGFTIPSWTFYIFLFLGLIVAAVVGILLGLPVLRLRGDYLAIVTLGFGEMIRVLLGNLDHPVNITNGTLGLDGITPPPLPQFVFNGVASLTTSLHLDVGNTNRFTYQLFFYLLVILICLVAVIFATRLENSPIGRAWTAIREDETAAIAMGVPLVRMKLLAFATGAAFAGAMGVLYSAKQTSITPDTFDFTQSIFILAMVIIGGMGSIRGVIVGALVVTLLNLQLLQNLSTFLSGLANIDYVIPIINYHVKDWPSQLEPAKYQRFVFGILLIIMMIFRPEGLLPAQRRKMEIRERMGRGTLPPAPGTEEPELTKPPTEVQAEV